MVRDLVSWLASSKNSNSKRSAKMNLKIIFRKLSRSQKKLEKKEKTLEKNIQKSLKRGDTLSAKMYARDLLQSRKWIQGYYSLNSKIEGLIHKLDQAEAVKSLSSEMKNITSDLKEVSRIVGTEDMDQAVTDLASSLDEIDEVSEIMEEGIGDVFAAEVDDTEVDSLVSEFGTKLGIVAASGLPAPVVTSPQVANISDLEKEIEDLKKE